MTLTRIGSQGEPRGKARRAVSTGAGCLLLAAILATAAVVPASAGPTNTGIDHSRGRIVPVPNDIPHSAGAMIDRRLIENLRYLADRFGIFVVEGYAGPLGRRVIGCPNCHVSNSDHKVGLAADIIPFSLSNRCDRSWRPITNLARWAEPRESRPVEPFRWVGYDGDYAHGCGHHLHLSWVHSETRNFRIARWVEVFDEFPIAAISEPPTTGGARPPGPNRSGGVRVGVIGE